jgi:cyclophilin family peptidyl-prolyl cis-trans isomerase
MRNRSFTSLRTLIGCCIAVLAFCLTPYFAARLATQTGVPRDSPDSCERVETDPVFDELNILGKAGRAAVHVPSASVDWGLLRQPPILSFSPGVRYYVTYETSEGDVVAEMFPRSAPLHVSSHLFLASVGFFNGSAFHRIIPGFIDQTGAPPTGTVVTPYSFSNEIDKELKHDREGRLSSAHSGPGTTFSQWSFLLGKAHHLDGEYTIFGSVGDRSSLRVLKVINEAGTKNFAGTPRKHHFIRTASLSAFRCLRR